MEAVPPTSRSKLPSKQLVTLLVVGMLVTGCSNSEYTSHWTAIWREERKEGGGAISPPLACDFEPLSSTHAVDRRALPNERDEDRRSCYDAVALFVGGGEKSSILVLERDES